MSKNIIYGAGVLGLIAATIYIYQEHKKAKEAEAEPVVNIDSEETEDTTKEQKKEVITKKVTSLGRKIGKTLGTAALKFGAKHPKITKFILKFGRYIPYALIGIAVINSFAIKWKVSNPSNYVIDGSDLVYDENTDGREIEIEKKSTNEESVNGWDEKYRENYDAVVAFANSLNLFNGEMFIIEDQKQYIDDDTFADLDKNHPIVSHLVNNTGVYPEETL